MSLKEKRIRSINWDEEEEKEFATTIENKSLDNNANKLKTKDHEPAVSFTPKNSNNYVDTMVNYTKSLKDEEHKKRLEILEVELNIQKEKLKSAILEREILEIRKAKELI